METYRQTLEGLLQRGLATPRTSIFDLSKAHPTRQVSTEWRDTSHGNGPLSGETIPTFPDAQEHPPYTGLVGKFALYKPPEEST